MYTSGLVMEYLTPACAAKLTTMSGLYVSNTTHYAQITNLQMHNMMYSNSNVAELITAKQIMNGHAKTDIIR